MKTFAHENKIAPPIKILAHCVVVYVFAFYGKLTHFEHLFSNMNSIFLENIVNAMIIHLDN